MKELKNGELISLYMAYESEWEYRDSSIWNIVTKMFVVTLTTILIPFLYKEYCENYVPVSYTHLDVYKRQIWIPTKKMRKPSACLRNIPTVKCKMCIRDRR